MVTFYPSRISRELEGTSRAQVAGPMQLSARTSLLLVTLAVSVAGCAQKRTQPIAKQSAAPVPTTPAPPPADPEPDDSQVKRPRFGEAAVYVDGRAVGVLRNLELPSSRKGRTGNLGEGYEAKR